MKKAFLGLVAFVLLSAGAVAEEDFDLRLWAKTNAAIDPRVLRVEEHHACSGTVALIRTKRMPQPSEGPFEGEKVVELSKKGEILSRWYMPIDEIVLGIEGTQIIVTAHGSATSAIMIGRNGKLSHTVAPKLEAQPTECQTSAQVEFGKTAFLRCFIYRDISSSQQRILGYQGPCT